MKRIAIVTDAVRTHLWEALRENLEEVLRGYVDIRPYALETLRAGELIKADIVLVMSRLNRARDFISEARRILVVQRTVREREIYPIFSIPLGTRVLVVNDEPETTLETVALLQHLEINHLQYVPYEEGMDCEDFRIAITPGEPALVPRNISKTIDLGNRCIDISTFIEIINRLGISDREVDRSLLRYSEGIVTLDTGVNHQYRELFVKNTELDTVVSLSHDGILLVNAEGKVTLCNRALKEMLSVRGDISGEPISVFDPEIQEVLSRKTGREWIVEHKGRSLVITRKHIDHFGEPSGSYYNFQEVTYIRQLEQNLSQRLRGKGLTARYHFPDLLTNSPRMLQCVEMARIVASSDLTVLILGESGTGKELLAQSIHNESKRGKQPFVAVNCAAVPENLLESELFGYEGGSFTGALKKGKTGLFEQANHGTIFLDEIADMPLMLQAKLLRVLQERQIMRVGSQNILTVNIRVIAATNHDLRERIRSGHFREDLYYRLNALPLLVPPLRERPEDILTLLGHFLTQHKKEGLVLSREAQEVLRRYSWPGNIRELENVAGHLALFGKGQVSPETLPYYLLEPEEPFGRKEAEPRCGADRARAVLMALSLEDRGAGRKSLGDSLVDQGFAYTECEVRSILRALKEAGLVRSNIGRRGSELTVKGRAYLNGPQ